jgi:hypothetical protein
MMQEFNRCVRNPTSISPNEQVRNPGLFQCADGDHTCNENGNIQIPCPDEQILGMINGGVLGTASGEDMQQLVEEAGVDGNGRATACYASDLANRLMGWTGIGRTCDPKIIGDYEGIPTEASTFPTSTSAPTPTQSVDKNDPTR